MPNDKDNTLLRIEGDASGAKKAAAETKAAVADMADSVEGAGERTAEVTRVTTHSLEDQAEKADKGAKGFDGLAKNMGTSERAANAFREAIGRLSPQLAAMLDVGIKGGDILNFTFSKLGLIVAGISASVTAVYFTFQRLIAAFREAKEALEGFAEAEERFRQGKRAAEGEVVQSIAKAGTPTEALGGTRTMARKLTDSGVDRGTAVAIAPYLVDEKGEPRVSDVDAMRMAVAQQIGLIEPLRGVGREKDRYWRAAQRRLQKPEVADAVANAVENFMAAQERRLEEMAQGMGRGDIEAYVQEQTGAQGEALTERVDKVFRQLREGRAMVPAPAPAQVGLPYEAFDAERDVATEVEEWDALVLAIRRENDQRRQRLREFQEAMGRRAGQAPPGVEPAPPVIPEPVPPTMPAPQALPEPAAATMPEPVPVLPPRPAPVPAPMPVTQPAPPWSNEQAGIPGGLSFGQPVIVHHWHNHGIQVLRPPADGFKRYPRCVVH